MAGWFLDYVLIGLPHNNRQVLAEKF